MDIPRMTSRGIVMLENPPEHRKKDKLTGIARKVAIVDTVLAVVQVLYAQFRLLRPDHPLRRDVFTQFMDQSFIFPLILFTVITLQGTLAIRLFFATTLVTQEAVDEAIKRCRWWCGASVLFLILSLLDLYVIVVLLAFDAYRRFTTIAILTFIRLFDILFRIFGLYFVSQLRHLLDNPATGMLTLTRRPNSDEIRFHIQLQASLTEPQVNIEHVQAKLLDRTNDLVVLHGPIDRPPAQILPYR